MKGNVISMPTEDFIAVTGGFVVGLVFGAALTLALVLSGLRAARRGPSALPFRTLVRGHRLGRWADRSVDPAIRPADQERTVS